MYNWRRHYAIKKVFDQNYSDIPKQAGIYLWTRLDGNITYFYVGQAKNLFNRRFDYYKIQTGLAYPTRHFEASLKKHKDWQFQVLETCPENMLDLEEKRLIDHYNSLPNHITRNELIANQDIVRSNYRRIKQIENKAKSDIVKCLDYLNIEQLPNGLKITLKTTKKGIPTKLSSKYYTKLIDFLTKERKKPKNEEEI